MTVQLVVTDIDGTLLNSQHQLTERTEQALKAAMEKGVQIVLATGKTRASAQRLIERLHLTTPGIYLQGLAVYDGDGALRYQQALDPSVARQVITFAEDRGFSIVAYSGTRVLVRSRNRATDEVMEYHEVEPEAVGPLQNLLDRFPINKLMATNNHDPRSTKALRWQLSMQINGGARLVQSALAHQLEILPPGASKGTALRVLLNDLGIPSQQVMAIGDAENDIEMLRLAGVAVAVGNASQKVKDAADHIVASNDEDGVAEAIERFVLKTEETSQTSEGQS